MKAVIAGGEHTGSLGLKPLAVGSLQQHGATAFWFTQQPELHLCDRDLQQHGPTAVWFTQPQLHLCAGNLLVLLNCVAEVLRLSHSRPHKSFQVFSGISFCPNHFDFFWTNDQIMIISLKHLLYLHCLECK